MSLLNPNIIVSDTQPVLAQSDWLDAGKTIKKLFSVQYYSDKEKKTGDWPHAFFASISEAVNYAKSLHRGIYTDFLHNDVYDPDISFDNRIIELSEDIYEYDADHDIYTDDWCLVESSLLYAKEVSIESLLSKGYNFPYLENTDIPGLRLLVEEFYVPCDNEPDPYALSPEIETELDTIFAAVSYKSAFDYIHESDFSQLCEAHREMHDKVSFLSKLLDPREESIAVVLLKSQEAHYIRYAIVPRGSEGKDIDIYSALETTLQRYIDFIQDPINIKELPEYHLDEICGIANLTIDLTGSAKYEQAHVFKVHETTFGMYHGCIVYDSCPLSDVDQMIDKYLHVKDNNVIDTITR